MYEVESQGCLSFSHLVSLREREFSGGMFSCFNLCQGPPVSPCVKLMRVQAAVCSPVPRHWPRWSEPQGPSRDPVLYLWWGGLINVIGIHFHPARVAPPRGRSAGRSLALRTVVPHKQQGFSYLSFCQCLYSGRLRCIPAEGLACFSPFSSPLSFNHVTRAELLRLGLVHPGNGSYSGTPSSVHWDVSSEASSVRAGEEVG